MAMRFTFALAVTVGLVFRADAAMAMQDEPKTAVKLVDPRLTTGVGMTFERIARERLTDLPSPPADSYWVDSKQDKFRYFVDLTDLQWRSNAFRDYVIVVQDRDTREISEHRFRGVPSGVFRDAMTRIELKLQGERTGDVHELQLPVGSVRGGDESILKIEFEGKDAVPVWLLGSSERTFTVTNTSDAFSVFLEDPKLTYDTDKWARPPRIVEGSSTDALPPLRSRTFKVLFEPRARESLESSFTSTSPDEAHTELKIEVPYDVKELPGRHIHVPSVMRVRFQPSLLLLASWLLGGLVLGSLLPLVTGGAKRLKEWPRSFLAALVAAIILQVFATLFVISDSELKLLGAVIDPRQPLAVLFVGIVAGALGLSGARRLQKEIQKRWRGGILGSQ